MIKNIFRSPIGSVAVNAEVPLFQLNRLHNFYSIWSIFIIR